MEQNHIIHKVVIEVSVNNRKKAYEIKDNISSFLTMDVFPKLEKHFNKAQAKLQAHTLQISRLSLDINQTGTDLNAELESNIITALREELSEKIIEGAKQVPNTGNDNGMNTDEQAEISLLGEEEKLMLSFIHFIEKGYMPWWNSSEKTISIFEPDSFKKIVSAKAFTSKMMFCMQNPKVRERIINQLTDNQIEEICRIIIQTKGLAIVLKNPIIKKILQQSLTDRKAIWSLILNVLIQSFDHSDDILQSYTIQQSVKTIPLLKAAENEVAEEQIWQAITAVFPFIKETARFVTLRNQNDTDTDKTAGINKKNSPDVIQKTIRKGAETGTKPGTASKFESEAKAASKNEIEFGDNLQDEPLTDDEVNGYQVENAGLVIIQPFMYNLFKHCSLVDPVTNQLTDPETAVHLLHYIATGKTNQPESGMLFEKFLCNIPFNQSINRHIKLSRKQKSEAAKVIKAVQQNWSAMKTSSVGLLQHEFFQRPGKLVLADNQTLTIERKTQDILLDKLSWGISMIKLPWHNQFIFVNW